MLSDGLLDCFPVDDVDVLERAGIAEFGADLGLDVSGQNIIVAVFLAQGKGELGTDLAGGSRDHDSLHFPRHKTASRERFFFAIFLRGIDISQALTEDNTSLATIGLKNKLCSVGRLTGDADSAAPRQRSTESTRADTQEFLDIV
jgi:hypothetical protein